MKKPRKMANGTGSVYKLSGNRRNPWAVRKTIGMNEKGHPIYRFIGFYRTYTEAYQALMEYNKNPYSLDGETLKIMYERFHAQYAENHKPNSVHNIEVAWDHLAPLHDEHITKLTRKKLQLFFDGLESSQVVKSKVKSLLKQIYGYSIRYDIIPPEKIVIFDYIDLTSSVPVKNVKHHVFTDDEIQKLKEIDDDMAHAILFLIYTGLRAGEFCALTDEDIDDDMVLRIREAKTASGIRSVPLSEYVQNLAPVPHFASYYNLRDSFAYWRKKKGIDHNLHDTRHTCASLLANAGVDERVIKAILGHKGKGVTEQVYTHISIDTMRDALNLISVTNPVTNEGKITHDKE